MLGRGGMGVVYLGEDAETGQAVALKTVLGVAEPLLASLRREIHALSRLRHPGVVRILAEGTCGGLPWYAMEFLQGGTLRDRVDALRARRAPLVDTLTLVRRLCEPLAFLHGHGIVHRDLKPENVFIQPDGTPVLVDFGLSAQFSGARGREVLALGDENSGSDAYIAPEQILGEFVDARADLYALGCILYDLLTGQPPFVATGGMSVLAQHLRSPPVPPSRRTGGLPEEVDRLVLRLLEKKPRDRLGYADDVAAALVALGAERPEPGTSSKPQAYLYRPDFLGRAAVLERLQEPLRRARNHQGGQLFIGGESGVGKTRLAMELAAEAKVLGLTVIAGECQAFGPALRGAEPVPPAAPLHPLRPFLLAVADKCREQGPRGTDQLLGPRGRLLAAYEPTLAELPGQQQYPAPSPLPSDAARRRLLSALRATLRAFAAASPLLLILDDLQWADELTLHLLRDLQEGGEPGVLIVGTYRLEEMGEVLQEVVRAPGRVQVTLDRLASEHVGAMVRGMLALSEVPWTFTEFLIRHSSGNPFFVAEYLRSAMAQGLLYRDRSGAWLLAERGNVNDVLESSLPMPGSLAELIQRRLAVLDAPVRALAQWAS
ncbi:MAG TPA: AAA family ATPase, partial [Myxococcaceae bacterium]